MSDICQIDISIKNKISPINVITYSAELNLVIVGRQNGVVEIFDYRQNFLFIAKIIVSNKNPVDGLKFMRFKNDIKLFGISSSKLFEIDLSKNYIKQEIIFPNNQCARALIKVEDKIVVGCDGGYIHIYEYISEIKFLRTIHNAQESVLSMAFSKLIKDTVFVGSQGRIYKINIHNNCSDYFELTKENRKQTQTYIWCLEFIGKYLFSGDSKGMITIWNAENFGIIQSFSTHKADILSIVPGINCLYASGYDPDIVKLELNNDCWVETSRRHGMVGDVRSLCLIDSRLIAGGLNCTMSVFDLKSDDSTNKPLEIDWIYAKNEFHFFSDANKHILFTEVDKSIRIYEIFTKDRKKTLLRTVKADVDTHLQAWSASKSLKYLAYSTNDETRVLRMSFSSDRKKCSVDFKRYFTPDFNGSIKGTGPRLVLPAAQLMRFIETPEGRTFLVIVESFDSRLKSDNNAKLRIYELFESESLQPILKTTILAKDQNYFNSVHQLETSDRARLVAFSTLDGLLFIYSMGHIAMIKKIARQPTAPDNEVARVACMRFNEQGTSLWVMYTNKRLMEIDCEPGRDKPSSVKWTRSFNANLRSDWIELIPLQIEPVSPTKILVLTTKKLMVQLDMEKPSVTPKNVSLFVKKRLAKKIQTRRIEYEIEGLRRKIDRMKSIYTTLQAHNDVDAKKPYEKREQRYLKKIDKLKSLEIDEQATTCFGWFFLLQNTAAMQYFPSENSLLSVSVTNSDQQSFTYRKKIFGL